MIRLTVTTEKSNDGIYTKMEGKIGGSRVELVGEVAHMLLDLYKLEDHILTDAMVMMLDKLIEERKDDE